MHVFQKSIYKKTITYINWYEKIPKPLEGKMGVYQIKCSDHNFFLYK